MQQVTIVGLALQATTTVRTVRLELAASASAPAACTAGAALPVNAVATTLPVMGSPATTMVVTLNSSLSEGQQYSVCINYTSEATSVFVPVGTVNLVVGE